MARDESVRHPDLPGFDYVEVLGSGGFSDVYLYRQKLPRRRVAVKVLRLEAEDSAMRREFVAEANAMAQLSSHPSIATIFAADISPSGHPYLVMEYCPGGSLAARSKAAPIPFTDVLSIGVRMASALESAHRAGIVHRDVKPSNILLNELKSPVLTDFGISIGGAVSETTIMRDSTTTATTRSSGLSVPWAPPEAFLDDPPSDPRSDVYSLAATLFTLLEQRTPFELATGNNGAIALSRRIERGEITPPTIDGVPGPLHALLKSAMAVGIDARPNTALEFAELLQNQQRSAGVSLTPIELLTPEAETPEEHVGETTRVRLPKRVDSTVVRAQTRNDAPPPELDVETATRPPRTLRQDHASPLTKRRRLTIVAIAAAAALVVGGIVSFLWLSGRAITPCSATFAQRVSETHAGADVTSIWWSSVPSLHGPTMICGVATEDLELYILDATGSQVSEAVHLLERDEGWTCDESTFRPTCEQAATGAFLYIWTEIPQTYERHLGDVPLNLFYVQVHREAMTWGLPGV